MTVMLRALLTFLILSYTVVVFAKTQHGTDLNQFLQQRVEDQKKFTDQIQQIYDGGTTTQKNGSVTSIRDSEGERLEAESNTNTSTDTDSEGESDLDKYVAAVTQTLDEQNAYYDDLFGNDTTSESGGLNSAGTADGSEPIPGFNDLAKETAENPLPVTVGGEQKLLTLGNPSTLSGNGGTETVENKDIQAFDASGNKINGPFNRQQLQDILAAGGRFDIGGHS